MSGTKPQEKVASVRPQYMPQDDAPTQPLHRSWRGAPHAAEIRSLADVLHLAELVPVVRQRLDIPDEFSDDSILSSLRRIANRSSDRERWRAAFDSNLARYLASCGRDLGLVLQELITLIPPPRM
jgi:hypothetical protein